MRRILLTVMACAAMTVCGQELEIHKSREKMECSHPGIRRCVRYDVSGESVPECMDGVRVAFVTDMHYASRFTDKTLESLGRMLRELNADIILLGGDYQEGCEYVEPLFREIMTARPRYGAYGVLGNNDYERCTEVISRSMSDNGIKLLENAIDTINIDGGQLIVAGAKNTFKKRETVACPTGGLSTEDFVLLITHTPDYVEDVECPNVDMAFAGHLHGGQVTLFGLYAPVMPSHYGQRFRHGLKYSTAGVPILVSNGIGTSRKNIRLFAAAEIHLIVFRHKK